MREEGQIFIFTEAHFDEGGWGGEIFQIPDFLQQIFQIPEIFQIPDF
jgi:hypothetical protein